MTYKQGYQPDFRKRVLRIFSRIIANIFLINGKSEFGNIFLQAVNSIIEIKNPLDSSKILKFRAGHERLHWRITETAHLEEETNAWIETFKPGEVFIDVGSNIGMFSLSGAQARHIKCISFELDPLNIALQHENIFLNHLQDLILLVPIPLSEKSSSKSVCYKSISPGDALHSLDAPSPMISEENRKAVRHSTTLAMSLDDVYDLFDLARADHLKLDVDGTELNILLGSTRTLRTIKSVMCECTEDTHIRIKDFLRDQGFCEEKIYLPKESQPSYNVLFRRDGAPYAGRAN